MPLENMNKLPGFLAALGLEEEPMGLFYTGEEPEEGFSPKPLERPTREREMKQEINWQGVFGNFSCVMGNIWRARKKGLPAYFSAEKYGCPGGSFWLGFHKPQTETIIAYVSTGVPGHMEGELYCDSPDELRRMFEQLDPRPAPAKYCVVKPLGLFHPEETPELVIFFARPETVSGLHQLATYVTNDPEVVASPWSAACGSIAVWPLHYLRKGQNRAVLGGWDPSARKFFNTDEISFTVPLGMFEQMLASHGESFLTTKTWSTVQKKIARSKKAWS